MPIGIFVNVASVAFGALLGMVFSKKLSQTLKEQMTTILGLYATGMGIVSISAVRNLPAIVLAMILGTILGITLQVGISVKKFSGKILQAMHLKIEAEKYELLITAIVIFCFSSSGIYGALNAGMTGDNSILMAKSMLDFFTAMIIACNLGKTTMLIAIPQSVILALMYVLAQFVIPLVTETMLADFKACGGFLMIAAGLRMMRLKAFPIAEMVPAMLCIMPISYIWSTYFYAASFGF